MRTRCVTVIAALCLLSSHSARAQNYAYTLIADTGAGSSFGDLLSSPSINNAGTVAFRASLRGGGNAIVIGSGGATTTLYDTGGPFDDLSSPSINDAGTVAFAARLDEGGVGGNFARGIFTGNGGATTTIAATGIFSPFLSFDGIDINNAGTVAFRSSLLSGVQGVFTGDGGAFNVIDVLGGSGAFYGNASINDAGTVAFVRRTAVAGAIPRGVFTSNGGFLSTLYDTSGPFREFGDGISINNAGTVSFFGAFDAGGSGIFTGNGGPTSTVVDNDSFMLTSGAGLINDAGTVLFVGAPRIAGGPIAFGYFTGPDPVANKVIQDGDSLFASTISFSLGGGLNNAGQFAFVARLADGRQVLVRADPINVIPEPGSFALITAAFIPGAGLVVRRRRRKPQPPFGSVKSGSCFVCGNYL